LTQSRSSPRRTDATDEAREPAVAPEATERPSAAKEEAPEASPAVAPEASVATGDSTEASSIPEGRVSQAEIEPSEELKAPEGSPDSRPRTDSFADLEGDLF